MQVSTTSPNLCHINSHMYPKLQLKTQLPATPSMYHTLLMPSTFRLHVPYSRIFLPLHSQAQFHLFFSFFFFKCFGNQFFSKIIFSFIVAVLGLRCYAGFSLVTASGGYSPGVTHGLLIVVASLVVEHRLSSCGTCAQWLRSMWDLPRPGIEPVSLALQGGFLTTGPPGKPKRQVFNLS